MPTPPIARLFRHRVGAFIAAICVVAAGTVFWPATPAFAAPDLSKQCSTDRWQDPSQWKFCVDQLENLTSDEIQCVMAPIPENPDSGMAGWFASKPTSPPSDPDGRYTRYGYGGYDFTTYDIGCAPTLMHPDYKFENTIANGEFLFATAIVGASNGLREKAWNPQSMWGWSNPLVEKATKATYQRVFTVFGAITLAVIGLYLLWRSRQADMSSTTTTAGWAILVMVAVTAVAAWPVRSAQLADQSLIGGLSAVHDAVGPPTHDTPPDKCGKLPNPEQCKDQRTPSQRASDVAVQNVLYRNWLRGVLGSADSETARKYGPILYDSKTLTWGQYQEIQAEIERDRNNQDKANAGKQRKQIFSEKQTAWEKVAKQIKTEDPGAYEYLQGTKGMDRIGAGFVAVLSALFFALFDITASILVLLGFLIFRWAVIAAPILGTIGMLRPASTGIRRLANAVIAAIFNIIIFGTGAAIYLFAVDLIMSTTSLAAWLQVTLILLTGVVGWVLLRPYRRITQLGGRASAREMATASGHRSFFRDLRTAATLGVATPAVESMMERKRGSGGPIPDAPTNPRPETRTDDATEVRAETRSRSEDRAIPEEKTAPATRSRPQWTEPEYADGPPTYSVYRPATRGTPTTTPTTAPGRRPESADVRG
ncbi:MAG: hypothetical protein AUI14_25630 [Actinobacteria bacterium 13_2_20CM_2_71_6]|nr:MAG: hypothetical protein AUI14_25630 [Actinobacteria bacterium 13_2_20CM_2_71_6]